MAQHYILDFHLEFIQLWTFIRKIATIKTLGIWPWCLLTSGTEKIHNRKNLMSGTYIDRTPHGTRLTNTFRLYIIL